MRFHYLLQSIGIDLYVERDDKQVFKPIALSELTSSQLVSDICQLLKIKPTAIESLADNEFRLGQLNWLFDTAVDTISINTDGKLVTPPLTQLRNVAAKRALWSGLADVIAKNT